MAKLILKVFLGVISGGLVVFLVEMLGNTIYPPPQGTNMSDPESLRAYLQNAPTGSILFVILAWALGSFAGGFVTALINTYAKLQNAMIVGMVLMIFGIFNLIMLPSPLWFTILGILVFIPFAYGGGMLAIKIKAIARK